MADIADEANERMANHLAKSLAAAVGKSAPEKHPGFNGVDCVDCDEPIAPARVDLGKVRCIGCQSDLESRRARGLA